MGDLEIQVESRTATGSNASRRLRAAGTIPAVVYGEKSEAVPIQVERRSMRELLRSAGGENAVFLLKLAGTKKSRHAMIRHLDVDPISRQIVHIDFLRINLKNVVQVQVPVVLVGEAYGVKTEAGVLDFISRELEVECLPTKIPNSFEVDITDLKIGDHLEASSIELPEGVKLLEESDKVLISISHARVVEEEEEEDEGLLEAEREEPELIGRVKDDEDDEGDAD